MEQLYLENGFTVMETDTMHATLGQYFKPLIHSFIHSFINPVDQDTYILFIFVSCSIKIILTGN
jgi:hypothetical protein